MRRIILTVSLVFFLGGCIKNIPSPVVEGIEECSPIALKALVDILACMPDAQKKEKMAKLAEAGGDIALCALRVALGDVSAQTLCAQ
jgi:hypothetical protein